MSIQEGRKYAVKACQYLLTAMSSTDLNIQHRYMTSALANIYLLDNPLLPPQVYNKIESWQAVGILVTLMIEYKIVVS